MGGSTRCLIASTHLCSFWRLNSTNNPHPVTIMAIVVATLQLHLIFTLLQESLDGVT